MTLLARLRKTEHSVVRFRPKFLTWHLTKKPYSLIKNWTPGNLQHYDCNLDVCM